MSAGFTRRPRAARSTSSGGWPGERGPEPVIEPVKYPQGNERGTGSFLAARKSRGDFSANSGSEAWFLRKINYFSPPAPVTMTEGYFAIASLHYFGAPCSFGAFRPLPAKLSYRLPGTH